MICKQYTHKTEILKLNCFLKSVKDMQQTINETSDKKVNKLKHIFYQCYYKKSRRSDQNNNYCMKKV